MTDQFEEFDGSEDQASSGAASEPTPASSFDAFLDGIEVPAPAAEVSPEQAIFVRSTGGGGGTRTIETTEPMTIGAIIENLHLSTGTGVEYWVNGLPVDRDFTVGLGGTVTVVTSVKGG